MNNNKGKQGGAFLLGMLVSFVIWFVVTMILLMGTLGVKALIEGKNKGSQDLFTEEELEKIEHYMTMLDLYYYEDIEEGAVVDGILYGLMEAPGDPYTCYYTKEEMEETTQSLSGVFQGIGAYLEMDFAAGYPKITGVIEGAPASEVDIQPGDYIIKVDGEDVRNQTLTTVVSKVRGLPDTYVELTLNRNGEEVVVSVVRKDVQSPSVKYELVEGKIAYITITEFADNTGDLFEEALLKVESDKAEGILIDLRGNPGGSLDAVVEVCNSILPKGIIVYTEDKYGEREEYLSDGKNEIDLPMVVLVDGNSASASEIMAGAIQDYKKGTLVGTTTFGKGIVQRLFSYSDGSGGKLTVSRYFTPNGNNIHGIGIEPDVVVEFDGEAYKENSYDNQYEEALKILKEKME